MAWIDTVSTSGTASGGATVEVNSSAATYCSNGALLIIGNAPGLTGKKLVAGQSSTHR